MSTVRASIGKMTHDFANRPIKHHSRSKFNRSHSYNTTFNAGMLIPIYRRYAYPGDTLMIDVGTVCRLAAQKVPFFTRLMMDIHFWAVPFRILWPNWTKQQGEQENPGDSVDYLVPKANVGTNGVGFQSLSDYLRVVPGVGNYDVTMMYHRAYTMTWNKRYRDENLQDSIEFPLGDTDNISNYQLLPRGKRKDYITGSLPFPQKGEDVLLPLGNSAPVSVLTDGTFPTFRYLNAEGYEDVRFNIASATLGYPSESQLGFNPLHSGYANSENPGFFGRVAFANTGLKGVADLSNAQAATMSQLYVANAVQQMLQLDAVGGTRQVEQILSRWGVRLSDYRAQDPEFLGGGTFDLNLQIVPQTSATNEASPQGHLASYGVINGRTNTIVKSFEEHSVVFAVASVRAGEYYYQMGLDRDFSKRARLDFYEPILANLPEQAVLNKEVFVQSNSVIGSDGQPVNEGVFGYQERWSEDKTSLSYITGHLRSNSPVSLDYWHLATDYESLPVLNSDFIKEDVSNGLSRTVAVSGDTAPEFVANFAFREIWFKEMPVYNNASFLMF